MSDYGCFNTIRYIMRLTNQISVTLVHFSILKTVIENESLVRKLKSLVRYFVIIGEDENEDDIVGGRRSGTNILRVENAVNNFCESEGKRICEAYDLPFFAYLDPNFTHHDLASIMIQVHKNYQTPRSINFRTKTSFNERRESSPSTIGTASPFEDSFEEKDGEEYPMGGGGKEVEEEPMNEIDELEEGSLQEIQIGKEERDMMSQQPLGNVLDEMLLDTTPLAKHSRIDTNDEFDSMRPPPSQAPTPMKVVPLEKRSMLNSSHGRKVGVNWGGGLEGWLDENSHLILSSSNSQSSHDLFHEVGRMIASVYKKRSIYLDRILSSSGVSHQDKSSVVDVEDVSKVLLNHISPHWQSRDLALLALELKTLHRLYFF